MKQASSPLSRRSLVWLRLSSFLFVACLSGLACSNSQQGEQPAKPVVVVANGEQQAKQVIADNAETKAENPADAKLDGKRPAELPSYEAVPTQNSDPKPAKDLPRPTYSNPAYANPKSGEPKKDSPLPRPNSRVRFPAKAKSDGPGGGDADGAEGEPQLREQNQLENMLRDLRKPSDRRGAGDGSIRKSEPNDAKMKEVAPKSGEDPKKKEDKAPQVWHRDQKRPTVARVYVGNQNSLELVSLQVSVKIEGPRTERLSITSSAIPMPSSWKGLSNIRCPPAQHPATLPCSSGRHARPLRRALFAAARMHPCRKMPWSA